MTKEEILQQAEAYAIEATCGLSYLKGFPLSSDQILGFFEIFTAYEKAAQVIYEDDGELTDTDTFLQSVYEDFTDFLDSDVPLQFEFCSRLVLEHSANKLSAVYILKNNLSTLSEIGETQNLVRRLLAEQRWEELGRMTGLDDEQWQEI